MANRTHKYWLNVQQEYEMEATDLDRLLFIQSFVTRTKHHRLKAHLYM